MGLSFGKILGSIGLSAIPVLGPMLAMKNLMSPSTPSQPQTPPPPVQDPFAQSQFSQYAPPPMTMPPPDAMGSGLPPTDPSLASPSTVPPELAVPPQYTAPTTSSDPSLQLSPDQLQMMQNIRA